MKAKPLTAALPFIAYFNICFFWGTSSVATRIGAVGIGALCLSAVRFLTASALLLLYFVLRRKRVRISRHDLCTLCISSVLMYFIYAFLLSYAAKTVPSSISTVLLCMLSVYIILCDSLWERKLLVGVVGIFGIVLSFVGVAVTVLPELAAQSASVSGIILLLLTPVCWGIGTAFLKNSRIEAGLDVQLLVQALVPAVLFFLCAFFSGALTSAQYTPAAVGAGIYMGATDSIIGLCSYMYLLKVWPTSVVSSYAFVNPVVGIVMSRLILGEAITPHKVIGMIVILGGVYLMQRERRDVSKTK